MATDTAMLMLCHNMESKGALVEKQGTSELGIRESAFRGTRLANVRSVNAHKYARKWSLKRILLHYTKPVLADDKVQYCQATKN